MTGYRLPRTLGLALATTVAAGTASAAAPAATAWTEDKVLPTEAAPRRAVSPDGALAATYETKRSGRNHVTLAP